MSVKIAMRRREVVRFAIPVRLVFLLRCVVVVRLVRYAMSVKVATHGREAVRFVLLATPAIRNRSAVPVMFVIPVRLGLAVYHVTPARTVTPVRLRLPVRLVILVSIVMLLAILV
jgi:hypothetical protein